MRVGNSLTEKLRPHVPHIKESIKAGSHNAAMIFRYYQMHMACPNDPVAIAFCESAFEDWKEEENARARHS